MRTDSSAGIGFSASLASGPRGAAVVTVYGELDLATAPKLRQVLADALDLETDIELDMRACDFVDSSGIAVLAWTAWQLKEHDLILRIRGVRQRIRGIFELAGLAGHSSIRLEDYGPPP